jgi:hypothetical protein
VGGTAGAAIGHVTGIPYTGELGAAAGAALGGRAKDRIATLGAHRAVRGDVGAFIPELRSAIPGLRAAVAGHAAADYYDGRQRRK